MGLVEYPDSEGEREVEPGTASLLKRKRDTLDTASDLPPLPSSFHDLYSTATRVSTSDDPSLHGGRKRTVPHVEGNWATHVYLEWHPTPTEFNSLTRLIDAVSDLQTSNVVVCSPLGTTESSNAVHTLLQSPLGTPLPLHISLSQPLILRTPQREAFLDTLISQLRRSSVHPFTVGLTALKWVANHEGTRWFLVLGVESLRNNELNRLLGTCNATAEAFNLPRLYSSGSVGRPRKAGASPDGTSPKRRSSKVKSSAAPPGTSEGVEASDHSEHFHVSIAWCLNPPDAGLVDTISSNEAVNTRMEKDIRNIKIEFDAVKVKIGNTISTVELSKRVKEGTKGILG